MNHPSHDGDTPPLVLVVDDERDLLALTSRRLRRAGYEVAEAIDGEDGWEQATARHPDALVLDVRMPRLDGIELTRRVRADAELRDAAVVLLTASVQEREEASAAAAGADAFLRKPCTTDELVAAVREAIERARR